MSATAIQLEHPIIYLPNGMYFYSPDKLIAYNKKHFHETAVGMAKSGMWSYQAALEDLREWNSNAWDLDDNIRFNESSNYTLIETYLCRLYLGTPAHHYWWNFKSSLEAITKGFEMAQLAFKLEIPLDEKSRAVIDRLCNAWEEL